MDLGGMDHPARSILCKYWHQGSPVVLAGRSWKEDKRYRVLDLEPHQSTMAHELFSKRSLS